MKNHFQEGKDQNLAAVNGKIITIYRETHLKESLFIRITEVLEEIRDVISEHIIDCLNHLWFELLEFVNAVSAKYFLEMIHIGQIPWWEMKLSLNLYEIVERKNI